MKHIVDILLAYKLYSGIIAVVILLELVRIPLGTFNGPSRLDVVAHFLFPATIGPLLAVFLQKINLISVKSTPVFVFLAVLLGIFVEVAWEIVEFFVDLVLQLGWQLNNFDTMFDITLSVIGSCLGAVIFTYLYKKRF